jgi:hypothetical protein
MRVTGEQPGHIPDFKGKITPGIQYKPLCSNTKLIGQRILKVTVMKISVICNITPYIPLKFNRHSGRSCCILQGLRIRREINQHETRRKQLDDEDGDKFHRNVHKKPNSVTVRKRTIPTERPPLDEI